MNILLTLMLMHFSISSHVQNSKHQEQMSCDRYYAESQYNELSFEGKLKSKSEETSYYKLEIIETDQTITVLKLFKNNLSSEIFTRSSVNDLFIKLSGDETLRVGYFVDQNLDVKLYDGLCK